MKKSAIITAIAVAMTVATISALAGNKQYVIAGGGPTGAYTGVICPAIAKKMAGFSLGFCRN